VNYYEHHLGDYMRDTAHLSMLEDGAYRRLLDAYYGRERPLPTETRDCFKLARATSKAERDAVSYVLREFFTLLADGYHQKRADAEIAEYLEGEPDREQRRQNSKERQRRSRERRRVLFEELRTHGITPPFDATIADLDAELSRAKSPVTASNGHIPVTRPITCDDTASHSPSPISQSPNVQNPSAHPKRLRPETPPEFSDFKAEYPKRAGDQGWRKALRAAHARITEGHSWTEIIAGAKRYAAFVRATGKEGSEYVKQAASFVGPDMPFLEQWDIPRTLGHTGMNGGSDPAAQVYERLIATDGRERDARTQKALDMLPGGWSSIQGRTTFDAPRIRQKFCTAWREAVTAQTGPSQVGATA
jgi:uncharacterized protein YdaU (DUF1376 family)